MGKKSESTGTQVKAARENGHGPTNSSTFDLPSGFQKTPTTMNSSEWSFENLKGKQIWLIKLPVEITPDTLNECTIKLSETAGTADEEVATLKLEDPDHEGKRLVYKARLKAERTEAATFSALLRSTRDSRFHSKAFHRELVVEKAVDDNIHDSSSFVPVDELAQPPYEQPYLNHRYYPFGATTNPPPTKKDTSAPSSPKKRKREETSSQPNEETSPDTAKKSSKKKKSKE